MVPLPGGGRAVDGDDEAAQLASISRAQAPPSGRRSRESWWRSCPARRRATGALGGQAQHQVAHGDAVVAVGASRRAAGTAWLARAAPCTIRPSGSSSTPTPQAARPGGHQGDAVALLDPQLADAAHHRRALGEGGGHRQDRIFVDHRGRALGGTSTPSAANGAAVTSPTGSPPSSRAFAIVRSAPISRRVSNRPVRSGLSSTPSTVTSEPGRDQRRDQREGGRGRDRPARGSRAPVSGWPPAQADVRAPSAASVTSTSAPKARSMRSVWSRVGSGSITSVSPAAFRPGQQHRRLHLGRGHRAGGRRSPSGRRPVSVSGSRPPSRHDSARPSAPAAAAPGPSAARAARRRR